MLARLLARVSPARLFAAVLLLTPLALLISLFSSGQQGVHRWIALGPLNGNAAYLCLPAATVAFAATTRNGPRWTGWAAVVIQLELCLQPDASQAASVDVTLLAAPSRTRAQVASSLFIVPAAALAWTRRDPLAPLPEVERIIKVAAAQSAGVAALCVSSLAAVVVSRSSHETTPGPLRTRPPLLYLSTSSYAR